MSKIFETVFSILLLLVSIAAVVLAALALINKDWPQACAWLLLEISCTISSIAARVKS